MGIFKKILELIIKDKIDEQKQKINDIQTEQNVKLNFPKTKIDIPSIEESEQSAVVYLKEKLKPLFIEILGEYSGGIFELIKNRKLIGWCWESTQTCSIFLNNDDYIERGDLYIDERNPEYYHSWICFRFNDKEYVFDPCLDCLCLKSLYYKRYNPKVTGRVTAEKVKEKFYDAIKNHKADDEKDSWLFSRLSEETKKRLRQEVQIETVEDVNEPFYRGTVGYRTELKEDKVEKMTAHYYMSGMI